MKVALLGCYKQRNYGSMLQTLANQKAVQSLGHSCDNLVYVRQYTFLQKLKQIPRVLNGGNQQKIKRSIEARRMEKAFPGIAAERSVRNACFDGFSKRYFTNLSKSYIGYDNLVKGSLDYDAVMVGSDQMWLPMGLPTNFYNLQFAAPGVRRISYATSFGVSSIPWYQKTRTADYLRKIDFLSVREDAGAKICKEIGGVDAEVVVDPTLLLTYDQWLKLIPNDMASHEPYIFCYFLGTNPLCRQEANALRDKTGLPIVVLRHLDEIIPSDEDFGDEAPYDVDPAGFVNLIRNAEFVLTDSFHGTVFSVVNHKKFATFYRFEQADKQSRNSRIDSLFAHLKLQDRLITQEGETEGVLDTDIDFDVVDSLLASWRGESWDFLRRALS